jgi:hypothetical protein
MFKRFGCFLRCAGCFGLILLFLCGTAAGGYYVYKSATGPVPFSETGTIAGAENAEKIWQTTLENLVDERGRYRDREIRLTFNEKTLGAMLLLSWNKSRNVLNIAGKDFSLPKLHMDEIWVKIHETGFESIMRCLVGEKSGSRQRYCYIGSSTELFVRNGKILVEITAARAGNLRIPNVLSSPLRKHLELKWYNALNSSEGLGNGYFSDLQLVPGSIHVIWVPKLPEKEEVQ